MIPILLALFLLPGFQDEAVAPTLVLVGGRTFDPVSGSSGAPAQLWIRSDRVLGERPLDAAVPEGARRLDASGCTLLPGLFDLHTHVFVSGGSAGRPVPGDPEANLRSQLACGVTNVVDLHALPEALADLRERSRTASDLARLHFAGAAFTVPGGHGTQFGIEANTVTSAEEVAQRFAALLPHRPDVIKAIVEHGGWGPVPKLPALEPDLLAEIARHAHEAGLPLFCHVWTLAEAKSAARVGARALVHGVFVGDADDELVNLMKEHGTAYVPTLAVVEGATRVANGSAPYDRPLAREALAPAVFEVVSAGGSRALVQSANVGGGEAQHFANLRRIAAAGIEIGTGTDAGNPLTPHGPALLRELELYVEAGLSPARALTAATLGSARILGEEERFGSLAPGRVADVVVVRGRPDERIADVWNVEQVVKGGVVFDRSALVRHEEREPMAARTAGDQVPATIDDFDDGGLVSGWGGTWEPFEDREAPGGASEIELSVADDDLLLAGEINEGFQWGAFAGATLLWGDAGGAVDAGAFDGVELRLRGTPRTYTLTVHRAAVKDYNVFYAALPVAKEWREVQIPFANLRQIGFGQPLEWSAADTTGLTVDARNVYGQGEPEFGRFELEIDWIRLYSGR